MKANAIRSGRERRFCAVDGDTGDFVPGSIADERFRAAAIANIATRRNRDIARNSDRDTVYR